MNSTLTKRIMSLVQMSCFISFEHSNDIMNLKACMCFLAMNVITWFHVSTMYKEFVTFFIKILDFPSFFLVLF